MVDAQQRQYRVLICVGTTHKRGQFTTELTGPDGNPVWLAGTTTVHRVGSVHGDDHRYFFECEGWYWADRSPRWFDESCRPIDPPESAVAVGYAPAGDYYKRVLSPIKQLAKLVPSECPIVRLRAYRIGLQDGWSIRRENDEET